MRWRLLRNLHTGWIDWKQKHGVSFHWWLVCICPWQKSIHFQFDETWNATVDKFMHIFIDKTQHLMAFYCFALRAPSCLTDNKSTKALFITTVIAPIAIAPHSILRDIMNMLIQGDFMCEIWLEDSDVDKIQFTWHAQIAFLKLKICTNVWKFIA